MIIILYAAATCSDNSIIITQEPYLLHVSFLVDRLIYRSIGIKY